MNMKRSAEETLNAWYRRKKRKPLVVRGARQVGKSTLVRDFAKKLDVTLHEINLERYPEAAVIFEHMDTKEILRELEYMSGKGKIKAGKSLLFLDEIQAVPQAIKALRYFYEDLPELPVIAAGSLLEFTLSDHTYSMPVGRIEYLFIGPMTFEEFLTAMNEPELIELIRSHEFGATFPVSAHQKLLKYQREYLLTGGMPEAVLSYIETGDFEEVANVHSSIVQTYRDEFGKYARGAELNRLHRVFDYVPSAAGDKIKYRNIDENEQSRELRKAVDLLEKAGVISCVFHSKASGLPIRAGKNSRVFKMFFLDVGLMNFICDIRNISFEQLSRREFINEGKMAEQFIQQHLMRIGRRTEKPELFYWLREGRSGNAEVDFVIQDAGRIVPVEIKAGKSGAMKSLLRFMSEKRLPVAVRFDLNPPSVMDVSHRLTSPAKDGVEFKLVSLPLYMVEQFSRLVL